MREAKENQFHQREEVLLFRVESAVQQLEAQGKSITASSIGEFLHMSETTLEYYPRVWAVLKQILNERAERRAQDRDGRLVSLVKSSIQELESLGGPVNYLTVSELTGVSERVLKRGNQLRKMIEEAQKNP